MAKVTDFSDQPARKYASADSDDDDAKELPAKHSKHHHKESASSDANVKKVGKRANKAMKSAAKDVAKAKDMMEDKESSDLFKEAGTDSEKMMGDNVVQEYLENKRQKEKAAQAEKEKKAEAHSSKSSKKHKHKKSVKKAKGLA